MADDAFERTLASKTSRLNERAREISEQTFWKESSVRRYGRETKEERIEHIKEGKEAASKATRCAELRKALISETMASHGLPFEALVGGRPNSVVVSDGKFRFYILESEAEAEFVATSPTSLVFVVRHPLPKPPPTGGPKFGIDIVCHALDWSNVLVATQLASEAELDKAMQQATVHERQAGRRAERKRQ